MSYKNFSASQVAPSNDKSDEEKKTATDDSAPVAAPVTNPAEAAPAKKA
ncbi:hypothetical protein [Nisaea sediminum]|nr:hypothetical protein [Nisaea sediminum]